MTKTRKRYNANFKAKVAIEALKEQKTLHELSQEYELHSNQISVWKKEVQSRASELFAVGGDKERAKSEALIPKLYQEIGQLKVELDWLKKKVGH